MENEMQPYIVYVKPDEKKRITAVNSSAFLRDADGWAEIDRGYTQRHHHAQGNYFPQPIYDERGICRYKLEDGKAVERTQAEMDADWEEPVPEPDPSPDDNAKRIEALEAAMHAIEEGIASV